MRKSAVIFAILVMTIYSSNAQEGKSEPHEKMSVGFKIGTNYSNVYDVESKDFNADPTLGLALGVFISLPINTHIGLQPEVLFSQKGFQGKGSFLGKKYEFTRTTDYLDIPLLFSIKPEQSLTLLVGPQYSFLVKKTDRFTNSGMSIEDETEFQNDNIRNNTLCFLSGIDLNLTNVVVGVRVGWDVITNNGDGTSETPRYKNTWYQFTIGYRFYTP